MGTNQNKSQRILLAGLVCGLVAFPAATEAQTSESMLLRQVHVSELSDVKPTDWAFTALQSLVERYACIAGYPNRTYRGAQAISRFEFAAGVSACLDKINEILASGLADKVSKDDLAKAQRLQQEFAHRVIYLARAIR